MHIQIDIHMFIYTIIYNLYKDRTHTVSEIKKPLTHNYLLFVSSIVKVQFSLYYGQKPSGPRDFQFQLSLNRLRLKDRMSRLIPLPLPFLYKRKLYFRY